MSGPNQVPMASENFYRKSQYLGEDASSCQSQFTPRFRILSLYLNTNESGKKKKIYIWLQEPVKTDINRS